ncbi:MAG: exodeoxyribonuclease V subunit beta [Myxococcota bacterium]|nr:exodeoxyribonuclease V subunit beta [Myxococcota bacterium]
MYFSERQTGSKPRNALDIPLKGINLIEASAGTGKTYTLTTLVLRLIAETDLPIEKILVVTFTEAAAAELKVRVRARLKDALKALSQDWSTDELIGRYQKGRSDEILRIEGRIARALRDFDAARISTIHGFCKRMLEENAFESSVPFDSELIEDESALVEEIARDFWAKETYDSEPIFVRALLSAGLAPSRLTGLATAALKEVDTATLPDGTGDMDPMPAFLSAFEQLQQIWQKDRKEIIGIIKGHPGLNAARFPPGKLDKWFEELESALASAAHAPLPVSSSGKQRPTDAIARFARTRVDKATKKKHLPPDHPFFDACEAFERLEQLFDRAFVAFKARLIAYVRAALSSYKRDQRLWSFDDLLAHLDRALQDTHGHRLARRIRDQFDAVMIDEFQDTDARQYRIFRTIMGADAGPLYLIGDPKQAIYGFRGADIFAYLEAAQNTSTAVFTLDTNWRSQPSLIAGINALFGRLNTPFLFDQIKFTPVRPREGAQDGLQSQSGAPLAPFQIRLVERRPDRLDARSKRIPKRWTDANLPQMVAADIAQLLSSRITIDSMPIAPTDVAVLTRTNHQARAMRDALGSIGIQGILLGSNNVFDAIEADQLATLLDAVLFWQQRQKVKAALATDIFGMSANEIFALDQDDGAFDRWSLAFRSWLEKWQESGFMAMIDALLAFAPEAGGPSLSTHLLGRNRGTRQLTNLRHLAELLHTASMAHHLSPSGLARWFNQQRTSPSNRSDASQQRLETDAPAVTILTMHKAKGLEFKVVYCPYLWDGRLSSPRAKEVVFHDPHHQYRRTLDLGSPTYAAHTDIATQEELAENIRLLYVALTRAKNLCISVWGGFADMHTSALGYVLHQTQNAQIPKAVRDRLKKMTDKDVRADLDALVALAGPHAISISTLESPVLAEMPLPKQVAPSLEPRRQRGSIPAPKQIGSFTAIVSAIPSNQPPNRPPPVMDLDQDEPGSQRVCLAEFEGGPRAGTCLHAIFEDIDFTNTRPEVVEPTIAAQLDAYGFDRDVWMDPIQRSIADVVHTPLSAATPDLRLDQIPVHRRFVELAFVFPLAPFQATAGSWLSAQDLAQVLAGHSGLSESYAKRIKQLDFVLQPGFIQGAIDLVFEWEGKYYLADYKSNHLGYHSADYAVSRLERVMVESDYVLQYYLYTVALNRFLKYRVNGYDYDRHFGGVYYLFIRGLSPRTGPNAGLFWDKPPRSVIEGMSKLMGEPIPLEIAP